MLWDESISAAQKQGTRRTLLEVLEMLLKVAHPVMPFITETLWHQVAPRLGQHHDTIMVQHYPSAADYAEDVDAVAQVEWLKKVISGIRNIRGEANIKPSQEINLLFQGGGAQDRERAGATAAMLKRLANVSDSQWLEDKDEAPPHALALVGDLKVMVPLAGLIDVAAEQARLDKELQKARQDLERIEKKLNNESFVAKAPEAVVAKERDKAADLQGRIDTLAEQHAKLSLL
jgi:valyl-tRNA synthetase